MRRMVTVVALVCIALAAIAVDAVAQDERPRGARTRSFRNQARVNPAAQKAALDKALGQLDLKKEQKEKIDGLQAEYDKTVKANQEKNKEKQAAFQKDLAAAREAGDREKMGELMQQRRQTQVAAAEQFKKHVEAIKKELTDEQKKKLDKLMLPPIPANTLLTTLRQNAEALALSEEQSAAIKKLIEESRAGRSTDAGRTDYRKKMQELRESGAGQEEMEKLRTDMRESWTKRREEATKRDQETREKLMKILNEKQRTQLEELARKRMTERRGAARQGRRDREGGANRRTRPQPEQGQKTGDKSKDSTF